MTLGFHINLFPGEESEISRLRKASEKSEEYRTAEINKLTWQVKRERERTLTLAERQKKCAAGFRDASENLEKERALREVDLERMTARALEMSEEAARSATEEAKARHAAILIEVKRGQALKRAENAKRLAVLQKQLGAAQAASHRLEAGVEELLADAAAAREAEVSELKSKIDGAVSELARALKNQSAQKDSPPKTPASLNDVAKRLEIPIEKRLSSETGRTKNRFQDLSSRDKATLVNGTIRCVEKIIQSAFSRDSEAFAAAIYDSHGFRALFPALRDLENRVEELEKARAELERALEWHQSRQSELKERSRDLRNREEGHTAETTEPSTDQRGPIVTVTAADSIATARPSGPGAGKGRPMPQGLCNLADHALVTGASAPAARSIVESSLRYALPRQHVHVPGVRWWQERRDVLAFKAEAHAYMAVAKAKTIVDAGSDETKMGNAEGQVSTFNVGIILLFFSLHFSLKFTNSTKSLNRCGLASSTRTTNR